MGAAEKRLAEMRENQKGWRYDEVRRMLEGHGFALRSSSGGSHRVFKHPAGDRVVVIDAGSGTVLPVYVRKAIDAVDRAQGAS